MLGSIACLSLTACFIAAVAVIAARKYQQSSDSRSTLDFQLDDMSLSSAAPERQISTGVHSLMPTVMKQRTIIGKKYELINKITRTEAQELFKQTGIKIEFPPDKGAIKARLGKGNFGRLRLARNLETGNFVVTKKIKGEKAIRGSKDEVEVHKRLTGQANILPLYDSVEVVDDQRNQVLYLFMEPAGFGNGEKLSARFGSLATTSELQERVLAYTAKELLTGMRAMHAFRVFHRDMKPSNFVMESNGKIWVIDFGCAGPDSTTKGDVRYFAPEVLDFCRDDNNVYDPAKADAWALGVLLLEIVKGGYPFPPGGFKERVSSWGKEVFEKILSEIPELDSPKPGSMMELIKGLLNIDSAERLSVDEALKHPAIMNTNLSVKDRAEVFSYMEEAEFSFKAVPAKQHLPRSVDDHYGPESKHAMPEAEYNNNGSVAAPDRFYNNGVFYNTKAQSSPTLDNEARTSSVALFPKPREDSSQTQGHHYESLGTDFEIEHQLK